MQKYYVQTRHAYPTLDVLSSTETFLTYYSASDVDARIAELERVGAEYIARTDPLLDKLEPMSDRIAELEDKLRIAQSALDNIYGWSSTIREHCHPKASRNVAGWINDKARDARKSLMER